MAGKRLPKNIDLANNVDIAAGFFSTPTKQESEKSQDTKKIKKKNLGGRPKKEGLKNQQFTLTMHPEMYEKLRILANEYTRGNFSGLIDEAVKSFCREHKIDLSSVKVSPEVLDMYQQKQEKKRSKK